jgi:hypothetical protein
MSFQGFTQSITAPELRAIAAHWDKARGSRRMPAWSDIDPVAIGRNLRYIWSWKYDRDTDSFTGRLAGEDIVRAIGKSMRGLPMTEFFTPDVYEVFFPWHRRIVVEPAFLRGTGLIYSRVNRNFSGERIMMPLADDGTLGDGIVGATLYRALEFDGKPLEKPTGLNPEQVAFYPLD